MAPRGHAWQRVYDHVRGLIDQGKLQAGDRVPAELQLKKELDVSRQTVRAALTRLQQEGVITEGRGSAGRTVRKFEPLYWNLSTFERGDRRDDPATGVDEWRADMYDQGVQEARYDISVGILPAPIEVANCLQIEPGTMTLRRRRIRRADGVPLAIADTWVEEEIGRQEVDGFAPLLAPTDTVMTGGIFKALGYLQIGLDDEFTARMPTPEEIALLDLPMGSPVGALTRVGRLEGGRPIRVIITVFAGHRLKLRYRLEV